MTTAAVESIDCSPSDLLGEWRLDRRVADYRIRRFGTVRGALVLRADGDRIRWVETGQLSFAGVCTPVSREYRLRREADGWWVLFPDDRPFHPWRPGEWVRHLCGADDYYGLVVVGADGRTWRTLWDVRGPGKAQRIVTRLTRVG